MKLEVNGITKSFGEKQVLSGITFSASSGSALGLLGRNGAGKTTTIRIILGLFEPDSGTVMLDGAPFDPSKNKIGYMPEERGLYPKNKVLEQLIYFGRLKGMTGKAASERAKQLLSELEMQEYSDVRLSTLSKGNQQKIQLAATLISDPDIVVLDEPFSGLDPVNAVILKNMVRSLIERGSIVLFSSHQMNYIEEFCHEVVILSGGKAAVSGNIEDIREKNNDRCRIEICSHSASDICSCINQMQGLAESCDTDGYTVFVKLHSAGDKELIFKALAMAGIPVDEFRVCKPDLSDIFVKYTEESI